MNKYEIADIIDHASFWLNSAKSQDKPYEMLSRILRAEFFIEELESLL